MVSRSSESIKNKKDGSQERSTNEHRDSTETAKNTDLAEIAVNAPLGKLFHYLIPPELQGKLDLGHRVLVPFGPRTLAGVIVGFPQEASVKKLKPIKSILQPDCRFDQHLLEFTRWIARYYHASWGEVLEAALPPAIRAIKKKKTVSFVKRQADRDTLLVEAKKCSKRAPNQSKILHHFAQSPEPQRIQQLCDDLEVSRDAFKKLASKQLIEIYKDLDERQDQRNASRYARKSPLEHEREFPQDELTLHSSQEEALKIIRSSFNGELGTPPKPILLHGVTGSGKTEVYLRALKDVLDQGGRGLVLVPEISLTPQTVRRFEENLPGTQIAVLHSMLSSGERAYHWREIQTGKVGLVIGARSAIFSPIPNLKLIIVDEEHEPSYKQESSPRYNGRDMAVLRAKLLNIPVILGSATPAIESYHNAKAGKYELIEMPFRATAHNLPNIIVQELDKSFYRSDGSGLISGPLDYQLKSCLKRGDQAIIFLNRRGFSTFLHCLQCGHVFKCEDCDITLTYHQKEHSLRCHYCDSHYKVPEECPECQFTGLRKSGVGTEKLTSLLESKFPTARVGRLDRDTVKNQQILRATLDSFAKGNLDILVGTQMLAKGHDFPGVSLVGIITADTGLHFPDFRSCERTFQLITQVAGRAGRGERKGKVILQTFFPDHPALQCAVKNDYLGLYEIEKENREFMAYPPFGRLAKILIQHEKQEKAESMAMSIADRLEQLASGKEGVEVLGPVQAPISRIQDRHRYHILVKSRDAGELLSIVGSGAVRPDGRLTADIIIDIDPQSML